MALLEYNQILPKKFVVLEGQPFEVLSSHVFRKQQRKPVNQTKLKNIKTGKVVERSFHQSEKVEEAELEKRAATYLYNNRGAWWFCEGVDKSKRFQVAEGVVGEQRKFLKENSLTTTLIFNGETIGFKLPIKVDLEVTDAAPAVRGNTAQGATKTVVLETSAAVTVPLFVNEGDVVRVNTETGEYTERVEKK